MEMFVLPLVLMGHFSSAALLPGGEESRDLAESLNNYTHNGGKSFGGGTRVDEILKSESTYLDDPQLSKLIFAIKDYYGEIRRKRQISTAGSSPNSRSDSTDSKSESPDSTSESTDITSDSTDSTSESTDSTSESTDSTSDSTDITSDSTESTSDSTESTSDNTGSTTGSPESTTGHTSTTLSNDDNNRACRKEYGYASMFLLIIVLYSSIIHL